MTGTFDLVHLRLSKCLRFWVYRTIERSGIGPRMGIKVKGACQIVEVAAQMMTLFTTQASGRKLLGKNAYIQ